MQKSAQELASEFREMIKVDQSSPISVKDVLNQMHIFTVYRDMSNEVRGMSLKSSTGEKAILVNSTLPVGKQHETIAHELFHLYFDPNIQSHIHLRCRDVEVERDASEFAQKLLLPEAGVGEYLSGVNVDNPEEMLRLVLVLENRFRVSRDCVLSYLECHSVCSQEVLASLRQDDSAISSKKYGYGSRLYNPGNKDLVVSDYENVVKELFGNEMISIGHYNDLITQLKGKPQ